MKQISTRHNAAVLEILDQGYQLKAWHGPNLRQSLSGVSCQAAAWRPGTGRHNIREIAVYAAYWKYVVRRRLPGEERGTYALKGSNWFMRPVGLTERAWRTDLPLLESEHRQLRQAVADYLIGNAHPVSGRLIFGAAFHDVYHAGPIRLLRRLQAEAGAPKRPGLPRGVSRGLTARPDRARLYGGGRLIPAVVLLHRLRP